MGEPIKECWDRRQYHTGLAHIKRNRRTQFGILGAAIKPKWDGPTYPKGMTQLTNVAGPTLVKPAGPLQVSGLKILTSNKILDIACKISILVFNNLLPPIFFPPRSLKESERKEREQMKK